MAFKSTEDRLDEHAAVLGQIIVASKAAEQRLDRLEALVASDHEEAARQRQEAARQRHEAARDRQEADKRRQEADKEREEWAKERAAMNKRWGEIALKMGTFVEDVMAPNIPRIARELFGLGEIELSALRLQKRHATDPARRQEFDYVHAAPEGWILNETKASPRVSHIDEFRERLKELPDYFPEYQGRPFYPLFSSLHMASDLVTYCTRQGIYALALGDDTVDVLNFDQLHTQT